MLIVAQKSFGFVSKTLTTCSLKFVEEIAADVEEKDREKTDSSEYTDTEPGEDEDEEGLQKVAEAARKVLLRPGSSPPKKADPKQAPRKKQSAAALAAKTPAALSRRHSS